MTLRCFILCILFHVIDAQIHIQLKSRPRTVPSGAQQGAVFLSLGDHASQREIPLKSMFVFFCFNILIDFIK